MAKKRCAGGNDQSKKVAKCNLLSSEEKNMLFKKYIECNLSTIKSLVKHYTDHYQYIDDDYNYVLTQMYNYIGTYDPAKPLHTWIHIVTKRAVFNQNKKRAVDSSNFTDIEMCSMNALHQGGNSMVGGIGVSGLIDNLSDTVYSALMSIPPRRLHPFLLHVQGYTLKDIADIEFKMGHLDKRSSSIVSCRIFWAKKELQLILRRNGITGSNHQGG